MLNEVIDDSGQRGALLLGRRVSKKGIASERSRNRGPHPTPRKKRQSPLVLEATPEKHQDRQFPDIACGPRVKGAKTSAAVRNLTDL